MPNKFRKLTPPAGAYTDGRQRETRQAVHLRPAGRLRGVAKRRQTLYPECSNRRYILHMAESLQQHEADALIKQVQESNNALASDTQALDQAAQTATAIAGEIQNTQSPPATPAEPAPEAPLAASAPVAVAAPPPPAPAPVPALAFAPEVQRLLAIEVPVIVQLGVRRMNVGEVMHFAVGAIVEFSKSAEEELELLANNKAIGKGYAVKVGENFGIKLTAIGPVKETIRKLGAA